MTSVISEVEAEALPLDLMTMRAAAARLIAEGVEPPSDDDLDTLSLQLRGHIELLAPAVEQQAACCMVGRRSRESALGCAVEARMDLRLGRGDTLLVRMSVAEKLARSVRRLCYHLERLSGGEGS